MSIVAGARRRGAHPPTRVAPSECGVSRRSLQGKHLCTPKRGGGPRTRARFICQHHDLSRKSVALCRGGKAAIAACDRPGFDSPGSACGNLRDIAHAARWVFESNRIAAPEGTGRSREEAPWKGRGAERGLSYSWGVGYLHERIVGACKMPCHSLNVTSAWRVCECPRIRPGACACIGGHRRMHVCMLYMDACAMGYTDVHACTPACSCIGDEFFLCSTSGSTGVVTQGDPIPLLIQSCAPLFRSSSSHAPPPLTPSRLILRPPTCTYPSSLVTSTARRNPAARTDCMPSWASS